MLTTIMLAEAMEQDQTRTRPTGNSPDRQPPTALVRPAVGRRLEALGRRLQGGTTVATTPC